MLYLPSEKDANRKPRRFAFLFRRWFLRSLWILLHEPRRPPGAGVRAKWAYTHHPRSQLVSAAAPRGPGMTTTTPQASPSEHGRQLLEALGQSVTKALDTKRRLGHYAVTWQNGKPLLVGDDAPPPQAAPPGR